MIQNNKARFNYKILEELEAGIALTGSEVKSLRKNSASLIDSYVRVRGSEAILINAYIAPYQAKENQGDSKRERRLLLHKKEIDYLRGKMTSENLTVVPLRIYFKGPRAKVTIALAKGKKVYEKREDLKKRSINREIEETLREGN